LRHCESNLKSETPSAIYSTQIYCLVSPDLIYIESCKTKKKKKRSKSVSAEKWRLVGRLHARPPRWARRLLTGTLALDFGLSIVSLHRLALLFTLAGCVVG
jgi:hypothetical protein